MLAVDTDVVVRYLANDDRAQAARARRLLAQHDVFVPLTVLLEAEWVLRGVFGFPATDVVRALRGFAGLPRVTVESADTAAQALDWAEHGLDFADALRLAAARPHDGFVTFDKALARTARRLGAPTVREP
jgi:predicted nucleic-acid-binding protein